MEFIAGLMTGALSVIVGFNSRSLTEALIKGLITGFIVIIVRVVAEYSFTPFED